MKICIPFQIKASGGSSTFVRNIVESLKNRGIQVTHNMEDACDLLFVVISASPWAIWRAKRRGVKVVQRLDGAYYFACNGWNYPLLNAKMKVIHQRLADFVIYQSDFSQRCCEKFLGSSKVPHVCILNPVDLQKFKPLGEKWNFAKGNPPVYSLLTTGIFRRAEMILPLLQGVEALSQRRDDFMLTVVGPMTPQIQRLTAPFKNKPHIRFLGQQTSDEIARLKNASHLFLYSAISACPNDVIEALAAGLPLLAFARGGVPELVNKECAQLVSHPQNEFWSFKPFNTDEFVEKLDAMLEPQQLAKMGQNARMHAEETFHMEDITDKYLSIFKQLA